MRIILYFSIVLGVFSPLFGQTGNGIVLATYHDSVYMSSLNKEKVQLPDSFLEEISHFNIISYEQAFPYSKKGSLKSVIVFYCKDNTIDFAEYLKNNATHLFSKVGYELDREVRVEYEPTDFFGIKKSK